MPRKQRIEKHKGVYEKLPGSDIWWIRYTKHGKRITESVGRHSDAVTLYRQRVTEIRTGTLIPLGRDARGIKVTSLIDDALTYSKNNHRDQRNFKQRVEVIRKEFGPRSAELIKPKDWAEWLEGMMEEWEWAPATYNRYKAAISKVYKLALQNDLVSTNPAQRVPQKKESRGRVRFLTEEEETRIRATIANKRPHCSYQLDIALHTGMRLTEQFTVGWPQVDFKHRHIYLNMTKNGSDRYVQLNDYAIASLKALKAEFERRKFEFETIFFDRKGTPIKNPREWFAAACEEAGVQGVTWHTLRHTFASRLVMAGVGLKTVQDLMGHKTIAMTARYAHLSPEHLSSAVNKISGFGNHSGTTFKKRARKSA